MDTEIPPPPHPLSDIDRYFSSKKKRDFGASLNDNKIAPITVFRERDIQMLHIFTPQVQGPYIIIPFTPPGGGGRGGGVHYLDPQPVGRHVSLSPILVEFMKNTLFCMMRRQLSWMPVSPDAGRAARTWPDRTGGCVSSAPPRWQSATSRRCRGSGSSPEMEITDNKNKNPLASLYIFYGFFNP